MGEKNKKSPVSLEFDGAASDAGALLLACPVQLARHVVERDDVAVEAVVHQRLLLHRGGGRRRRTSRRWRGRGSEQSFAYPG